MIAIAHAMKRASWARLLTVANYLALVLAGIALPLGTVRTFGYPIGAGTWVLLISPLLCALCITLAMAGWKGIVLGWLPLAIALGGIVTYDHAPLRDLHGGRRGLAIAPGVRWGMPPVLQLRFGYDTQHTILIESLLGPVEPLWYQTYDVPQWSQRSPPMERLHSRSLLFSEKLPEVLAILPNDDARRTCLLTITNQSNHARFHQGLLLGWLYAAGKDAGCEPDTWWEHHEHLFRPIYDPGEAAEMTWGWRVAVEAARFQAKDEQTACRYHSIERLMLTALYYESGNHDPDKSYARAMERLYNERGKPSGELRGDHPPWLRVPRPSRPPK